MITVYTPGVWDLLHIGHVFFLQTARTLGGQLVVGVASDNVVWEDKGRLPIIHERDRRYIISSLKCVATAAIYYNLDFLPHLKVWEPQILAVGEFWGDLK